MRIPKSILVIFLAATIAAAGYVAYLIQRGFGTKDTPSELEATLARAARSRSIPASAKRDVNPYQSTTERVSQGKESFDNHCAICHGKDGSSDTEIGRNLYPQPPDMHLVGTQQLSDGELFYIINNGVRYTGMPGWGTTLSNEEGWDLVVFIRHLPQALTEEKADAH